MFNNIIREIRELKDLLKDINQNLQFIRWLLTASAELPIKEEGKSMSQISTTADRVMDITGAKPANQNKNGEQEFEYLDNDPKRLYYEEQARIEQSKDPNEKKDFFAFHVDKTFPNSEDLTDGETELSISDPRERAKAKAVSET